MYRINTHLKEQAPDYKMVIEFSDSSQNSFTLSVPKETSKQILALIEHDVAMNGQKLVQDLISSMKG
jgi:hypothetical protein